jgi:hypothetical protein
MAGNRSKGRQMASWITCTAADGKKITVNADHVVTIRPHNRDRGGTGSEITFVGGYPSSLVVKENEQHFIDSAR